MAKVVVGNQSVTATAQIHSYLCCDYFFYGNYPARSLPIWNTYTHAHSDTHTQTQTHTHTHNPPPPPHTPNTHNPPTPPHTKHTHTHTHTHTHANSHTHTHTHTHMQTHTHTHTHTCKLTHTHTHTHTQCTGKAGCWWTECRILYLSHYEKLQCPLTHKSSNQNKHQKIYSNH